MKLSDFLKQYPDDTTCLDAIKNLRFPNGITCKTCKGIQKFYRIKNRPAYECAVCSFQVYPLSNTIFHKSSTKLTNWFYVIFAVSNTRSGVSAKTIQRELGVTYKCAWRMLNQVRKLTNEESNPLTGTVEVDESFFGGSVLNRKYNKNFGEKPKDIIIGMVEREGKAVMKKIPSTSRYTLTEKIQKHISPLANIMTDEHPGYMHLTRLGFNHNIVNHGKTYVVNKVTHTQNIEGLWGRIKPAIKGVYRKVSSKYLEMYINEFCFRYNYRLEPGRMFELLLGRVAVV